MDQRGKRRDGSDTSTTQGAISWSTGVVLVDVTMRLITCQLRRCIVAPNPLRTSRYNDCWMSVQAAASMASIYAHMTFHVWPRGAIPVQT